MSISHKKYLFSFWFILHKHFFFYLFLIRRCKWKWKRWKYRVPSSFGQDKFNFTPKKRKRKLIEDAFHIWNFFLFYPHQSKKTIIIFIIVIIYILFEAENVWNISFTFLSIYLFENAILFSSSHLCIFIKSDEFGVVCFLDKK